MSRRRRMGSAAAAGAGAIINMMYVVGSLFILLFIAIAKGIVFSIKYIFLIIKYLSIMVWNEIKKDNSASNQSKYVLYTMEQIDNMDGIEFERCVAKILKKEGYINVCLTKASGDYGVDIVAEKYGSIYAFQCKCYSDNLGLQPIQEVYSGAPVYNASKMVVVTNRWFTPNAKQLARKLNVQLWDRETLDFLRRCSPNQIRNPSEKSNDEADFQELVKLLPKK